MTDEAAAFPSFSARLPVALLQQNGAIAFLVLLAVILLLVAVSPHGVSYFDISTISASGTTLALAGIGETIVILGGGLDLSPGAVISLVNVVLVTVLGSLCRHDAIEDNAPRFLDDEPRTLDIIGEISFDEGGGDATLRRGWFSRRLR